MAVEIEPLLTKLAELAPHFGRARVDLEAMVSRGRSHDYRGVMQNGRLVVEVLLRSIVTDELKQTPGKATLEELVAKFRRQEHAGIVPTKILAHMGTVQAWGNLSAHDHSGGLDDTGVQVGTEEVVASLNSMVAILSWYAAKKGLATPAADARGAVTPGAAKPVERLEPTHLGPGRVIGGRYRLEARLAAGGMGEVYQATHLELGRKLALKLMRPELSQDAAFVERFRREAMTASRLGHPHIVDIIDSGRSDDGQFYFVMEFLEGKTLSALIDEGPVALPLALELGTQIAETLEVAHRAGVVHRDLKPDNVIVLDRGGKPFVKLVDFGIAKAVTSVDQKQTTHGVIMGTPQYMAPEQASGLAVDARADIYALGLIVFELLTGHPPLIAKTAPLVMSAHISTPAPPLPAQYPGALRALVAEMLAKSPADRPQTMAEVAGALAKMPTSAPAAWKRPVLAVVGVAAVAAGVVLFWPSKPSAPEQVVVPVPPPVTTPVPRMSAVKAALEATGNPMPVLTPPAVVDAGVPPPVVVKPKPQPPKPVASPKPKPPNGVPALLPAEGL